MQTLEARTYGYARHWKPFMVNNVSGFIGPETLYDGRQVIRADLEGLFMGKLHTADGHRTDLHEPYADGSK